MSLKQWVCTYQIMSASAWTSNPLEHIEIVCYSKLEKLVRNLVLGMRKRTQKCN